MYNILFSKRSYPRVRTVNFADYGEMDMSSGQALTDDIMADLQNHPEVMAGELGNYDPEDIPGNVLQNANRLITETIPRSRWIGGGVGAAGGFGLGALAGNYLTKNPLNKKRNMLIGGGIGTVGGSLLGAYLGGKAAVNSFDPFEGMRS